MKKLTGKTLVDAAPDHIAHYSLRVELYRESLLKRKSKGENGYVRK
ncbi:hypothetical protein [Rikenella microfusus]